MGKNLLLDTNILIDWFNGASWVKDLFRMEAVFYYSAVTLKELISKPGLSAAERKKIINLSRRIRLVPVTPEIAEKASILLGRYQTQGLKKDDALIAATAWVKGLTLFTRNRKHFHVISEIKLLS